MRIEKIEFSRLAIPFVMSFSHSSASRSVGDSVWVEVSGGNFTGYGESCPRIYVTGEDVASAGQFIENNAQTWCREISDFASLTQWIHNNERIINSAPAAFAAVELAMLDLFAKCEGVDIETLLGVAPLSGRCQYTAVVSNGSTELFDRLVSLYAADGFQNYKIKLSGDLNLDSEKVSILRSRGIREDNVRADANNLWGKFDEAADYLTKLDFQFWAIEEPLNPRDFHGLASLGEAVDSRIVLDESCVVRHDLSAIRAMGNSAKRFVPNIRVSKQGGLVRALQMMTAFRNLGYDIIVGAHVGESSLLTRAGICLANASGPACIGHEGGCGTHLLQHDVVAHPVMFGRAGILETSSLNGAGFGLSPLPHLFRQP